MSTNDSYTVTATPIRRTPSRLERLRARAAALPGLTDVTDAVCDRLALSEAMAAALTDLGLRLEMTEDARGSAIWAEAHDGLVIAAAATDDGRLEFDVANTRGPSCTHLVGQLTERLSKEGFELQQDASDPHDQPAGARLIRPVRPHLAAGGANPSAALLDAVAATPRRPPVQATTGQTPRQRLRGSR